MFWVLLPPLLTGDGETSHAWRSRDAAGIVNVVLHREVATAYHEALMERFVLIEGEIQRDGAAMSIVGQRIIALAPE